MASSLHGSFVPACCAEADCHRASSSRISPVTKARALPQYESTVTPGPFPPMRKLPSQHASGQHHAAIASPSPVSATKHPRCRDAMGCHAAVASLCSLGPDIVSPCAPCDGHNTSCGRPHRPKRRRTSWPSWSSALLIACIALLLFCTLPVTSATELSPRDLSKRAQPATMQDMIKALEKRQTTTQGLSDENQVVLSLSQPETCRPLNITWDPTKGTPPFTLYVAAELWFTLAIVNIPADYADPTLRQWLYVLDLPSFKDSPATSVNNPAIFASIIDADGKMANTSAFMTTGIKDQSCPRTPGQVEFDSWTDGGPVQCTPWHMGWNVTGTRFVGPMKPMLFPEKQPPIALTPPNDVRAESDGTGGMNWTVTVPAGTYIVYAISDEGSLGTGGGVGGKNLVGLNQYAGSSCVATDKPGLPTPIATAAKMLFTPDYTTQVTTTQNGAVVTVESVVHQGPSGSNLDRGSIIGMTLGIAAAAIAVLGGILYVFYRRNKKSKETLWEIPGGHSDYPKGVPIDRRFARTTGGGGGGNGAGGDGMMGATGSRAGHYTGGSFHSLQSSAAGLVGGGSQMSSPPTPSHTHMPYSDVSPLTPTMDTAGVLGNGSGSLHGRNHSNLQHSHSFSNLSNSDPRFYDEQHGATIDSPPMRNASSRRGSGLRSQGEAQAMANAYRSALGSNSGSGTARTTSMGSGGDPFNPTDGGFEEVQLTDRYRTHSHSERGGTTSGRSNVLVHHDAGLLLDDSLSDDEGGGHTGGIVELPPQYNSIAPRRHGASHPSSSTASGSTPAGVASTATRPAFHMTNPSFSSSSNAGPGSPMSPNSGGAHRSRANLLSSSADAYGDEADDEDEERLAEEDRDARSHRPPQTREEEKEVLEQRERRRAERQASAVAAADAAAAAEQSPSDTGVDGGSVFDRAGMGLGQPDEEFFWRRR